MTEKQVSDVVFGNELMRQSLDAIIHPAVKTYILEEIRNRDRQVADCL